MIPDIWPWARLLIQKKMATNATRMRMVGSHCPRAVCWGVLNLTVAMSFFMTWMSASKEGSGPFTVYFVPSLRSPVMTPVLLSIVADLTRPTSTYFWMYGLYWMSLTTGFDSRGGMI